MPKDQQMKQEIRYVFTKDADLSKTDFDTFEKAKAEADKLENNDEQRVRVRMRNRTGKWDVVVKRRRVAPGGTTNPPATGTVAKGM